MRRLVGFEPTSLSNSFGMPLSSAMIHAGSRLGDPDASILRDAELLGIAIGRAVSLG